MSLNESLTFLFLQSLFASPAHAASVVPLFDVLLLFHSHLGTWDHTHPPKESTHLPQKNH